MKKYKLALTLLVLAIVVNIIGFIIVKALDASASYIPSTTSDPCNLASAPAGQLVVSSGSSTSPCMAAPLTYASTTSAMPNVNLGAYASYPNPSGMFNTYFEATGTPVLAASFMGSTTEYVQIYGQNRNAQGSMDLVFADDKGNATSSSHYLDMGISNSLSSDATFTAINPLYGYLFNYGAPLIIGTGVATSTIISQGMTSSAPYETFDQYGHYITHGAKPSLSGCTGGTLDNASNSNSGIINFTGLLSLTSCVISYSVTPYPTNSKVSCTVNNVSGVTLGGYTANTTSLTIPVTVGLGGGGISYQCQASI